jgi:hypothetical protein
MWLREHLMEVSRCYYHQRGHRQGSLPRLVQLKKRRGTVCFVIQSLLAQPLAVYRTTSLDISLWHQHMACSHQMRIGEFLLRFQVLNTFALAACFL